MLPAIAIPAWAAATAPPLQLHAPDGFLSSRWPRRCGSSRSSSSRSPCADERDARRAGGPAARRDGRVHLRGPDVQLPGHRRDVRPPARRRPRGGPARAVGGDARHGLRHRRPGARVPGRRPRRHGREHLQHGRRSARSAGSRSTARWPGSSAARTGRGSRRPAIAAWVAVVAGAACMAVELAISGTTPARRSRCRRWSASTR